MNSYDNDIKAITETVKLYFNGTYEGDAKQLEQAFHMDAHITGIFDGKYIDWTLADFITRVTQLPTAQMQNEKYNKEILYIDKTTNTGFVKARVVAGGKSFIDYIILLKIDGQWIIRNKSFTTYDI